MRHACKPRSASGTGGAAHRLCATVKVRDCHDRGAARAFLPVYAILGQLYDFRVHLTAAVRAALLSSDLRDRPGTGRGRECSRPFLKVLRIA